MKNFGDEKLCWENENNTNNSFSYEKDCALLVCLRTNKLVETFNLDTRKKVDELLMMKFLYCSTCYLIQTNLLVKKTSGKRGIHCKGTSVRGSIVQ